MTKEECKSIIAKIITHYPSFATTESRLKAIVEEWYGELSKYTYEDIETKLLNHLKSEDLSKFSPKLYDLTRYVNTIIQKNQSAIYIAKCKYCGKTMKMDDNYDKHIERHNSIIYIKSREHYFKRIFNEEQLMSYSEEKFNIAYATFVEKLYEVIPDGIEKHCLLNIINSRYGHEIESSSVIANLASSVGGK